MIDVSPHRTALWAFVARRAVFLCQGCAAIGPGVPGGIRHAILDVKDISDRPPEKLCHPFIHSDALVLNGSVNRISDLGDGLGVSGLPRCAGTG